MTLHRLSRLSRLSALSGWSGSSGSSRLARAAQRSAAALALLAGCHLTAAAQGYDLTRFADPRGVGTNFLPTGINNALVVTGTASFQRGFSLSGIDGSLTGGTIALFDVPAAFNNFTFGDDINNGGVIVGGYRNGTGAHGFILNSGVYTTVDVPGSTRDTVLSGINDNGVVVGQYRDLASGNTLGFVKTGNDFLLLDAGQSQPNTLVQGINNAGVVAGSVGGGGTASRGFTFEAGAFSYFDAPGAAWTQAFGINNAGQIVGVASTGLFIKTGASFTTLQLPAAWNARNFFATDITDDGVIVGSFTDNGTNLTYGFLASPIAVVPEPSTALLLLAGGGALLARRRACPAQARTPA
jgi:hypothetical protein